jgi:hypothetical protein
MSEMMISNNQSQETLLCEKPQNMNENTKDVLDNTIQISRKDFIRYIMRCMLDYQKENNILGSSIVNVKYLFDNIHVFANVNNEFFMVAKPVIVFYDKPQDDPTLLFYKTMKIGEGEGEGVGEEGTTSTNARKEQSLPKQTVAHVHMILTGHMSTLRSKDDDDTEVYLDPSYEIDSMEQKWYFHSIKELLLALDTNVSDEFRQQLVTSLIPQLKVFHEMANSINTGNLTFDEDNTYYHAQADYVQTKLAEWLLPTSLLSSSSSLSPLS